MLATKQDCPRCVCVSVSALSLCEGVPVPNKAGALTPNFLQAPFHSCSLHSSVGTKTAIKTGHSDSLRAGRSGDRIPEGGGIFRTCPDRSWSPPSLLYSGYRVFPGGKAVGAWRLTKYPYSAEVKERVQLYLYTTSEPSWPVIGLILPLLFFRGSVPGNDNRFSPSPRCPNLFWDRPKVPGVLSSEINRLGPLGEPFLNLAQRLRLSGPIPPCPLYAVTAYTETTLLL
jgi:hypothetical protein